MIVVDWTSSENHFYLNPKFPQDEAQGLMKTVSQSSHLFQGHLFLLSSGTSSKSFEALKWVALSKAAVLASAEAVNRHLESGNFDIWLHTLPEFHVGGLGIWARSYLSGARVIQSPFWDRRVWDKRAFVELIHETQATLSALVPTQIYDLVNEGLRCPPSLRAVLVGGGALSPTIYRKALNLNWPLLPTYGMTETCSQIATASLDSSKKISKLLAHSIADSSESDVPGLPDLDILSHLDVKVDSSGKLQIKGTSLLTAYIFQSHCQSHLHRSESHLHRDPSQLYRVDDVIYRVEDPKEEGWFHSQDRGILKDGQLRVLGRNEDFVKIGGESVEMSRLREIFDDIRNHFEINSDTIVIPVPHDRLGHQIHLVCDDHISEVERDLLIEKFNSRVLGFEKIRKWHRLEMIPRTALGKLIPSACLESIQNFGNL